MEEDREEEQFETCLLDHASGLHERVAGEGTQVGELEEERDSKYERQGQPGPFGRRAASEGK